MSDKIQASVITEVTWSLEEHKEKTPLVVITEKGPRWSTIDLDDFLGNHNGSFAKSTDRVRVQDIRGFSRSARNLILSDDGKTLRAELRTINGDWKSAQVDLNSMFGNKDGEFEHGGVNYTATAHAFKLDGRFLKAQLKTIGTNLHKTILDLNNVLGNINGKFVWGQTKVGASSKNFRLIGSLHSVLECELEDWTRHWKKIHVNLDEHIGNVNGVLTPGGTMFSTTAHGTELKGSVLTTRVTKFDKQAQTGKIDLNDVLENDDGKLRFGKGFFKSARNCKLTGPWIIAELADSAGDYKQVMFDLGTVMRQPADNSAWSFGLPVIVAIPKGPEVDDLFLKELEKLFKEQKVHEFSVAKLDDGDVFKITLKVGTSEDEHIKIFKTFSEDISIAVVSIGDNHGKKVKHMSLDFLEAGAKAEVGWTDVHGVPIPEYAGLEAHLNLVKAECGPLDINVGVGADTGIGVKNSSLSVEVAGCGVTIGKVIGVKIFGTSISLDLGAVVDFFKGDDSAVAAEVKEPANPIFSSF